MTPGRNEAWGRLGLSRLLFAATLFACTPAAPGPPGATTSPPGQSTPGPSSPVSAFYTVDQAARGESVFRRVCAVCHGRTEFTGPIFELTWMAEPVGSLFQHISAAMPQDRPGSLSGAEYTDIIAYVLQLNGRAAGDRELPADVELLSRMTW